MYFVILLYIISTTPKDNTKISTSCKWNKTQKLPSASQPKLVKLCATFRNIISALLIKQENPMGIQMELSQFQPHFSPMSQRRQTNTDATGALRPGGIALTQTVRERQYIHSSHMVQCFLSMLDPAACCVWPFSRLFHTRTT